MDHVDLAVIGSGQGGVPLAIEYADRGYDVVLFERGAFGGSCMNYGCTPSKMLLASAHAAAAARNADDLGVHAEVTVDFDAVMARIRETTSAWSERTRRHLDDAGVRVVASEAHFVGPRQVAGGGVTVEADAVVIDTGLSPRVPEVAGSPGLRASPYLTYRSIWDLARLPSVTLVMGAGFVGIELGQALARLGSEVHFVERRDRPVPEMEPDVGKTLQSALEADGAAFHLDSVASWVDHDGAMFTVGLDDGEVLTGDALLVATGQQPNTAALNAMASGVELDPQGYVLVGPHFGTTCLGVYAIGDVTGQPAFTHVSVEDYRRLREILDGGVRSRMDRVLGYSLFTEPQAAHAGLTLAQARKEGRNAREETIQLSEVVRATEIGRTRGFYRMVVDKNTDRILGATLVSPAAAELIHIIIAHIEAGSTWHLLDQSVHIHPTLAEGLPALARRFAE